MEEQENEKLQDIIEDLEAILSSWSELPDSGGQAAQSGSGGAQPRASSEPAFGIDDSDLELDKAITELTAETQISESETEELDVDEPTETPSVPVPGAPETPTETPSVLAPDSFEEPESGLRGFEPKAQPAYVLDLESTLDPMAGLGEAGPPLPEPAPFAGSTASSAAPGAAPSLNSGTMEAPEARDEGRGELTAPEAPEAPSEAPSVLPPPLPLKPPSSKDKEGRAPRRWAPGTMGSRGFTEADLEAGFEEEPVETHEIPLESELPSMESFAQEGAASSTVPSIEPPALPSAEPAASEAPEAPAETPSVPADRRALGTGGAGGAEPASSAELRIPAGESETPSVLEGEAPIREPFPVFDPGEEAVPVQEAASTAVPEILEAPTPAATSEVPAEAPSVPAAPAEPPRARKKEPFPVFEPGVIFEPSESGAEAAAEPSVETPGPEPEMTLPGSEAVEPKIPATQIEPEISFVAPASSAELRIPAGEPAPFAGLTVPEAPEVPAEAPSVLAAEGEGLLGSFVSGAESPGEASPFERPAGGGLSVDLPAEPAEPAPSGTPSWEVSLSSEEAPAPPGAAAAPPSESGTESLIPGFNPWEETVHSVPAEAPEASGAPAAFAAGGDETQIFKPGALEGAQEVSPVLDDKAAEAVKAMEATMLGTAATANLIDELSQDLSQAPPERVRNFVGYFDSSLRAQFKQFVKEFTEAGREKTKPPIFVNTKAAAPWTEDLTPASIAEQAKGAGAQVVVIFMPEMEDVAAVEGAFAGDPIIVRCVVPEEAQRKAILVDLLVDLYLKWP